MKKLSKIGIVLALAAVAVAAQPAFAACTGSLEVSNTGIVTINGGATYSYISNPLGSPAFTGAFWSAGAGDPATLAGNDSGTLGGTELLYGAGAPEFGPGSFYLYTTQLLTNWGAGGVDGCINADGPTACTCVLLTEDGQDGLGYFALGSAQRDAVGNFIIQGDLDLRPLPKPLILSSSRNGTGVDLMVTVPAPTEGLNLDPACAGACLINATYRVLQIQVPRGAPMPDSRNVGDWTDISGGETPIGQNAMVSAACGAADTDTYLTSLITFDSGFAGSNVSGNATLIHCGTNLAEPEAIKPIQRRNPETPDRGGKSGRIR